MFDFFDFVPGFVLAVVLFAVLMCGFGLGRGSAATDCDAYGKTRIDHVVYVCSKVAPQP